MAPEMGVPISKPREDTENEVPIRVPMTARLGDKETTAIGGEERIAPEKNP